MNHTRENTLGIDAAIQQTQTRLYDAIVKRWNEAEVEVYGRAYKNVRDGGYIPEIFHEGEYKDVYLNDKVDAQFVFLVDDSSTSEDGYVFTTPVKCVCAINLEAIFGKTKDRNDAKARRDVADVLRNDNFMSVLGMETGIDTIYRGYKTDSIAFTDIHPYHIFAITGNIQYQLSQKC